jgi:hypothetical protein
VPGGELLFDNAEKRCRIFIIASGFNSINEAYVHLNHIQKLTSYLTENTLHVYYKEWLVDGVFVLRNIRNTNAHCGRSTELQNINADDTWYHGTLKV